MGQRWSVRLGRVVVVVAATAVTMTGCGASSTSQSTGGSAAGATGSAAATSPEDAALASAKAVASAITSGDPANGGGPGAAACAAFTADEVAEFVGVPLGAPEVNGPQGTQCQWLSADGESSAEVQIVPLDYWEPHSDEAVPGVDGDSFLGEAFGGWEAGAKDGGKQVVLVGVAGPAAGKDTVAEFLKLALERL